MVPYVYPVLAANLPNNRTHPFNPSSTALHLASDGSVTHPQSQSICPGQLDGSPGQERGRSPPCRTGLQGN